MGRMRFITLFFNSTFLLIFSSKMTTNCNLVRRSYFMAMVTLFRTSQFHDSTEIHNDYPKGRSFSLEMSVMPKNLKAMIISTYYLPYNFLNSGHGVTAH